MIHMSFFLFIIFFVEVFWFNFFSINYDLVNDILSIFFLKELLFTGYFLFANFLLSALGTKRLASEEFINDLDNKRLNAGIFNNNFLVI